MLAAAIKSLVGDDYVELTRFHTFVSLSDHGLEFRGPDVYETQLFTREMELWEMRDYLAYLEDKNKRPQYPYYPRSRLFNGNEILKYALSSCHRVKEITSFINSSYTSMILQTLNEIYLLVKDIPGIILKRNSISYKQSTMWIRSSVIDFNGLYYEPDFIWMLSSQRAAFFVDLLIHGKADLTKHLHLSEIHDVTSAFRIVGSDAESLISLVLAAMMQSLGLY